MSERGGHAVVVYQPGRCTGYIKEKEFLIRERVDI
jgi:hypothetical protein